MYAHYNLMTLHNVLQNVKLPHVTIEDLEELESRTNQIFSQPSSLKQMIEYIEAVRAKTVTQHKWVKEVLNKTIKNDLIEVRDKCRAKSHELRYERSVLIKQKQNQWHQEEDSIKHDSPFDLRGKYSLFTKAPQTA